jgi:ribosomal protein S18 acetylase RimI-like enzyme
VRYAIRRATAADAPAVHDLFHRSFSATFGHLYPPQDLAAFLASCTPASFRTECSSAAFTCFLGEAGDRLLGYATLGHMGLPIEPEGRWWVLRQLYLEEEAKGSGLANALMAHALLEARARGVEELYLTVWIDNHRARRFYERHGFEEVGAYPFVVGATVDDDRILRLSL